MSERVSIADALDEMIHLARRIKKENYSAAILIMLAELDVDFSSESSFQLRQAIQLKYRNPIWSYQEVYRAVGEMWDKGTVISSVEINIRYVIEKAWNNRANNDAWRIFMNEFREKRPTNAEFIGKITCIIELWQSCSEEVSYAGNK